jgi:uncharacterized protein with PIN domain
LITVKISGVVKCVKKWMGTGDTFMKTTTELYKAKVFDLAGDEYTVLGTYTNANTKISFRHNKCGSEISMRPYLFINGTRCRKCFIESRRRTQSQFEDEVRKLVADEYRVIGDYVASGTKIEIQHNKCGYSYMVTPAHFLNGTRCPQCFGAHKKSAEQFKHQVYELVGDEYTFLGAYTTAISKIPVLHRLCGKEYSVLPNDFIKGKRCPYCYGNIRKTTEEFKQSVRDKYGEEYLVIGEYKNNRTKIELKHTVCGHKYSASPDNVLAGYGCPRCAGNIQWTTDDFKKFVEEQEGTNYEVLGEYINSKTKLMMRHVSCGFEFKTTLDEFRNGNRCPYCRESKGEKRITDFLAQHQFSFVRQFRFNDCRYTRPLPFDFAVFVGDALLCLIEYHGRQHYEIVKAFGGLSGHEERRRNDLIKTDYCLDKGIPLIVVPYLELSNIELILEEQLGALPKC